MMSGILLNSLHNFRSVFLRAQVKSTGLDENPLTRAKIELGRQLYFDTRLSVDSTISCASCHDPSMGYTAQTKTGIGIKGQAGGRNSPVSFNRILSDKQFWDGQSRITRGTGNWPNRETQLKWDLPTKACRETPGEHSSLCKAIRENLWRSDN